ncbi:MAG: WD repeat-containing protein 83 [Candelina submexicana]|nr:MAG: WD repeat-containing protein 83 [Candelina submexicana]
MNFPTRQLSKLSGHTGPVHCATYSAGLGQYILSGGASRTIHLHNASNSNLIQSYSAHGYEVLDVAVTDDNSRFVSVGGDKQVFLWDVANARTVRRWAGHGGRVNCVGFGGEGSVVASDPITSVRQTRDNNAVLVSTLDSTIRLMDKGNGNLLQSYKGHTNKDYRIRSCLGMGDAYVISGSEDGQIFVWDLLEGRVVRKLQAHEGKVASMVAFNEGRGKEWVSAGVDGTVAVWGV